MKNLYINKINMGVWHMVSIKQIITGKLFLVPVCWVHRSQESSRYLRHQVAPEERRVHCALYAEWPVQEHVGLQQDSPTFKISPNTLQDIFNQFQIYYSIRKVSNLFFPESLVDFNAARLHETTLNLHTHTWFFSRQSVASVDGKQHLSEVVFSALIGFSLL